MIPAWARPVARLRHAAGRVVGAGVLAVGDVVLTCAHVVEEALAGPGHTPGRDAVLTLDFPFAGVHGVDAKVVAWYPPLPEAERRRDSPPSDLAVLRVDKPDDVAAIEACRPAEADPAIDLPFSGQGFPVGYDQGALAEGVLRGADGGGWIDVVAESAFGHFVEPGFSGAPVFAGRKDAVARGEILGLCATADIGGKRIARLIPPEHLARVLRDVVSPYRWLEPFQARDAAFFFGRDGLVAELWKELAEKRALLLAGPSGSGKSSILRAGLVGHALRAGWSTLVVRPVDDARTSLQAALGAPADPPLDDDALRERFVAQSRDKAMLVAIDQAEEILRGEAETGRRLLRLLADLREELAPNFAIALSSRTDVLGDLLRLQPGRLLERNLRVVDDLGRDELRATVELPARRLRVRFDPGLVETILNDVLRERVPLPVLQLCLSRLWELRDDNRITLAAYESAGRVTGTLSKMAREVVAAWRDIDGAVSGLAVLAQKGLSWLGLSLVSAEQRSSLDRAAKNPPDRTLRPFFLQLVEVGATPADDRRRRVPAEQLGLRTSLVRSWIEQTRLVLIHRDAAGQDIAELAHDSLLAQWEELRKWIDADRDFLRWQDRLRRRAVEAPADLLSDAGLAEAESWLEREGERIEQPIRDLITRSRAAQAERSARAEERLRRERDAALRIGSLFLAERSRQATESGDTMTGMLLALEALPDPAAGIERPLVPQAMLALHEALHRNHERLCLVGHTDRVKLARFSPDGTRIFTASADGTAWIWDAATGGILAICGQSGIELIHAAISPDWTHVAMATGDRAVTIWAAGSTAPAAICRGHDDVVRCVAFSPDGSRIATASDDMTVRLWNAATGELAIAFVGHEDMVRHVAFSPDGTRLVTASHDGTARIWDTGTGSELVRCLGHTTSVLHAIFSADGARVVTASADRTARVWDARTGAEQCVCEGHTGDVHRAYLSLDQRLIFTASEDGTARAWDSKVGDDLCTYAAPGGGPVCEIAMAVDQLSIATAHADGCIRVWEHDSPRPVATFVGHAGAVLDLGFSTWVHLRVVTAGSDSSVRVWDISEETVLELGWPPIRRRPWYHLEFSPDGAKLLTIGQEASLWDANDGREIGTLGGHAGSATDAAFSPDGTRLVTADAGGHATIWSADTLSVLARCVGHERHIGLACFSRDGRRILTASDDGTARLWDGETASPLAVFHQQFGPVFSADIDPQGERVVTAGHDGIARIWSVETGDVLAPCSGHEGWISHVEFSRDGTRMVTAGGDGTARLWDVATGTVRAVCRSHASAIGRAGFDPGGTRFFTAGDDGMVRVWDAGDGRLLAKCEAYGGASCPAAFSPDGARLLTARGDGTVLLWDSSSGALLATLRGHAGQVTCVTFSPDGTRMASASMDGTARVWRHFCDAAELVAFSKTRVTRGLSPAQRIANHLDAPDPVRAEDHRVPPSPYRRPFEVRSTAP